MISCTRLLKTVLGVLNACRTVGDGVSHFPVVDPEDRTKLGSIPREVCSGPINIRE